MGVELTWPFSQFLVASPSWPRLRPTEQGAGEKGGRRSVFCVACWKSEGWVLDFVDRSIGRAVCRKMTWYERCMFQMPCLNMIRRRRARIHLLGTSNSSWSCIYTTLHLDGSNSKGNPSRESDHQAHGWTIWPSSHVFSLCFSVYLRKWFGSLEKTEVAQQKILK